MKPLFIILCVLLLPCQGWAESVQTLHALAMHGTPKYGPDFQHLETVNPDAPKGGTLRMAQMGSFDTLNIYAIRGKAAAGMTHYYDRLMKRVWDEPFTLYGLVAEKIDIPDDRSWIRFHLRPQARFHDGTPLTARDVAFTHDLLLRNGPPNVRRIYGLVDTVTVEDDHTVRFDFNGNQTRETALSIALMPVHPQHDWEGRAFDTPLLDPPVGSGPYRIAHVDQGREIVYERDPTYWAADLPVNRGFYNFDRVQYIYFRDDSVALQAFRAGDLTLRREHSISTWQTGYADLEDKIIETIRHGRPEPVRALVFNTRRPPFDDQRVREALSLAFPADWINRTYFYGLYQRIDSTFPNTPLAATNAPLSAITALLEPWRDTLPPEVFAPLSSPVTGDRRALIKAQSLLREAGYQVQDGALVQASSGQRLRFSILVDRPEDKKIVLAFANALKRLGVTATVSFVDSSVFRGRLHDFDYDMVLTQWFNSLSPGVEQVNYWSSAAADIPGSRNYAGMKLEAVDTLITNMIRTRDPAAFRTHIQALDHVVMSGHLFIPLFYPGFDMLAYAPPLHRPTTTPLYGPVLESWWVEQRVSVP